MSAASGSFSSLRRGLRVAVGRHWLGVGAFALVAGTGFANGGYFPGAWGWATLGAGWASAAALVAAERVELSRAALAASGLLAALTAWTLASAIWTSDGTQTALEAERTAVYAATILAAVVCARRRPERLLHGAWFAISCLCVAGLATRLVPDRWGVVDPISGNRLSQPIGYWNSLGLLAVIGILLAVAIAARAETGAGRALAGASVPLLVTTLYFTYSRGSWVALGVGLVAMLALDPRHLQLSLAALTTAPWAAFAVWKAATSPALTSAGDVPLGTRAHEGHRLVLVLLGLTIVSALAALAAGRFDPRVELSRRARWAVAAGVGVLLLAGLGGYAAVGSPRHDLHRAWSSFAADFNSPSTLNGRLFSLNGSGRVRQWRVAWRDASTHPWLGSGAGTYEQYWNRWRPYAFKIRDAHTLYLETLAELGPFGLALLAGALLVPLGAAFRRRREPLAAAAFAALLAYTVHAAIDWDWEIVTVTVAVLLCAAYLLAGSFLPLGRRVRIAAAALTVVFAATGIYTVATRIPMNRLSSASARGDWAVAERDARDASSLAPWSSEPWIELGESLLNAGHHAAARALFERAAGKDPQNWVAWYDLARTTQGAERREALRRGMALNPLSPELAALGS